MKLFKETPVNDGYKTLQDDIRKTTDELQIVYTNLENVVEPDLIDYYIYQAKAVSMRYKFLLNCAKRLNELKKRPPTQGSPCYHRLQSSL